MPTKLSEGPISEGQVAHIVSAYTFQQQAVVAVDDENIDPQLTQVEARMIYANSDLIVYAEPVSENTTIAVRSLDTTKQKSRIPHATKIKEALPFTKAEPPKC